MSNDFFRIPKIKTFWKPLKKGIIQNCIFHDKARTTKWLSVQVKSIFSDKRIKFSTSFKFTAEKVTSKRFSD